jgi:hypothetical protein
MTYRELRKKLRRFKGSDHLQVKVLNRTTDLVQADGVDDVIIVTGGSGETNGVYIYVDGVKS